MRRVDVAIVGGGPAGLATAIEAARRGLTVLVLERRSPPLDKACGEGLMPRGVRALERLGALSRVDAGHTSRFVGIRWRQEECAISARFHDGFGLGIRRVALAEALLGAARDAGAEVEHGRAVRHVEPRDDAVRLELAEESLTARVLVIADGLSSPLRRALGLDVPAGGAARFGLRRHVQGIAGGDHVEVHWADGVEAYLTPVGADRLGVAFLWDARRRPALPFDELVALFPAIRQRIDGATPTSEPRGAGPFPRRARRCVHGRVVLVGDAAGYVDAITGEGLTLAFESARALGRVLPAAVRAPGALASYVPEYTGLFRRFAATAGALAWLAARPALRRPALRALSRAPAVFGLALRLVA